jgi:hypothetical protein
MNEAEVNGKLVVAGLDAPDAAMCPDCGRELRKRQRRRMDRSFAYYYRHKQGVGKGEDQNGVHEE